MRQNVIPRIDPRGGGELRNLAERLLDSGHLNRQQLQQATEVQQRTNGFLGQIVVDLGFVPSGVIGPILARDLRVGYIDLITEPPEADAVNLVSEDLVRSARAIPVRI